MKKHVQCTCVRESVYALERTNVRARESVREKENERKRDRMSEREKQRVREEEREGGREEIQCRVIVAHRGPARVLFLAETR